MLNTILMAGQLFIFLTMYDNLPIQNTKQTTRDASMNTIKFLLLSSLITTSYCTQTLAGSISNNAKPHDTGIYSGIEAGYFNISNYKKLINPDEAEDLQKHGSYLARLFLGYQFNSYFALEAGYTYNVEQSIEVHLLGGYKTTLQQNSGDVALKGILPLSVVSNSLSNASLYSKLGVAYTHYEATYSLDLLPNQNTTITYAHRVAPEFGGGAEYRFNNGLGLNLDYMRIQSVNSKKDSSDNQFLAGLSYLFAV